jgi:hypothetical protein
MTRQSLIRIVAGGAIAGCIGLAATPAFATTSTTTPNPNTHGPSAANQAATLAKIKADANTAIQSRLTALNSVIGVLNGLSNCAVAPLVTTAQTDITGLTALDTTIQADTTVPQARTDAQTIFTGYRVYALVIPVDHLVRAACAVTDVTTKLTGLETKWSSLNDSSIASLLADMQAHTQAAAQAVNGLAGTLEGYQPTDWNNNHGLLDGARSALKTARQDLEAARHDAKQIVTILRGEHHQNGQSGVSSSSSTSSPSTTAAA